jgi:hypothetical protein
MSDARKPIGSPRLTERRPRLRLLALVVVVAALATLSTSALASDALSVQIFDEDGTQQDAITLPNMYPTSTAWHTIVVEVPEVAAPGSLSLMFTNLRDYEHGCTAPEVRAGDTTCGPGPDQGELSEQLAVHIGVGWTSASDDPAACTDLVDVATVDVWLRDVEDTALGTELPTIDDGDTACVVLGLEFADRDDNNLAMGDETVFDLEVGLQGPAGDQTAVLGVALDAPGADRGEPGRPQLATTGAALSLLLAAALTALVVGRHLVRARPRPPEPTHPGRLAG